MRNPRIECKEFYDLMQAYRHAPITDQAAVIRAYEAVKAWIYKWHKNPEEVVR